MRNILMPLLFLAAPLPAAAQPGAVEAGAMRLGYADLADLALTAPIAAVVTVTDAIRLKPEAAGGPAPGLVRFFLTGQVDALIRGAGGLPGTVSWLADLPPDARGRPPKPKRSRLILIARPVAGRPAELRLAAPDGQLAWTAETEARLRALLTEAVAADAPPAITGVGNAFHVPGALPGESETQIFLTTADDRPVSLTVLRRPGEQPRWAVALGEIVDEAAAAPGPDTLLWYRLACALPPALPPASTARLEPGPASAARADYALVVKGLGPCPRTRGR